jgi:hypothetical protein
LDEETLPTSPKVATVVSVTLSCDNRYELPPRVYLARRVCELSLNLANYVLRHTHRAIEADVAGRLLHTFQSYVENPELMA